MKIYDIIAVVWCPTIEDSTKLLNFLGKYKFHTKTNSIPISLSKYWEVFTVKTCYCIDSGMVSFADYNYYINSGIKIITLDNFFSQYMFAFCEDEAIKDENISDFASCSSQKASQMNITEMINAIKKGEKCRRSIWDSNKFVYYVPAAKYDAITEVAKSIMDEEGKVAYKQYIALRCEDGEVGFYQPTQEDLFANDWEVINDDEYDGGELCDKCAYFVNKTYCGLRGA